MRSGCVGLIGRSSAFAGRDGECRYLFNLASARPFGLGPYIWMHLLPKFSGVFGWKGSVAIFGMRFKCATPHCSAIRLGRCLQHFRLVVFCGTVSTSWRWWLMAIACKPSLSNCRGVAAFRPRPSVNSSPGYRGPNCVE